MLHVHPPRFPEMLAATEAKPWDILNTSGAAGDVIEVAPLGNDAAARRFRVLRAEPAMAGIVRLFVVPS